MKQLRVGGTPLFNSPQLSGKCRGAVVSVKDESKNPFGTFKDRRCASLLERYQNEKVSVFVHITSGNSGYSLGMLAKEEKWRNPEKEDIKVVNIIDRKLSPAIKQRLRACSIVHEMELTEEPLTRDKMIAIARSAADYHGSEQHIHTVEEFTQANGYRTIITEIKEANIKPRFIVCPMGEGELATALTAQAKEVWPENTPTIIGITIYQNILVRSKKFVKKVRNSIADKLVNPYSKFRELVDVYRSQGRLNTYAVSDRQIAKAYNYLNSIGIDCEPSAAAAFAGAQESGFINEGDIAVIINTGKGIYDQKAIDKLWISRLWRGVKRTALVMAGVGLAAIAANIYHSVYKREHDLFRRQLEIQAVLYFDKISKKGFRNYWLDADEILNMCTRIPNKKCEAGPHPVVHNLDDFKDKELAFLVTEAENLYAYFGDMVTRDTARRVREAYNKGWFRIEGTKIKWDKPPDNSKYMQHPLLWDKKRSEPPKSIIQEEMEKINKGIERKRIKEENRRIERENRRRLLYIK